MSTPIKLSDLISEVAVDLADRFDPTDLIAPSPLQEGDRAPDAPLQGPTDPSTADLTRHAHRIEALRHAQAKAKEWKEIADEITAEIKDAMGGEDGTAEVAVVDGRPVARWTRVKSNRLNQAALKKERPEIHALYVEASESRRFTLVEES
jgi:predicted phage-related endonuclease